MNDQTLTYRAASRQIDALEITCVLLITASVAAAFTGLGVSSMWLDEFFTAYHAGPEVSDLQDLFARTGENDHPPAYFWLVWVVWKLVPGDYTIIARGLSAVLASAVIPTLYFGLPNRITRSARLYACAIAATSALWFNYAQEARSYALTLLLAAALFVLAMRMREAWAEGRPARRLRSAFVLIATLGGLTHFYMVHLAAGLLAALILLAPAAQQRKAMIRAGMTFPLPVLTFVTWQLDTLPFDPNDVWMQAQPSFFIEHILRGIHALAGSNSALALTVAIIGSGLAMVSVSAHRRSGETGINDLTSDLSFLAIASAIAIALAILVSVAAVPHFSYRFFVVLAPAFWISAGLVAAAALNVLHGSRASAWTALLLFALMLNGTKVAWRDVPAKQPWRETAQAVEALPGCANATLPVAWLEPRGMAAQPQASFYGYYLPDGMSRDWLSVPRTYLRNGDLPGEYRALLAKRLSGEDPCPLLLWSVHMTPAHLVPAVIAAIEGTAVLPEGAKVTVRRFQTPQPEGWRRWLEGGSLAVDGANFDDPFRAQGFLFLLERG